MKILGIDPAKKTGIAFWDTAKNKVFTYPAHIKNTMTPEVDVTGLDRFLKWTCDGEPDFLIMERPFLGQYDPKDPKQNITGFETHVRIVHYWEQVINKLLRRRFKYEKKGKINPKTKARLVYPGTWKSVLFEGIMVGGGDKIKSKAAATKKFPELPKDLTGDEYDAICLVIYQWLLCRDLGIDDLPEPRKRVFEAMRRGGWILATTEERDLLK